MLAEVQRQIAIGVGREGDPTAMLKARKSLMPTEKSMPAQSVIAMVSRSNIRPCDLSLDTAFNRKPCSPNRGQCHPQLLGKDSVRKPVRRIS